MHTEVGPEPDDGAPTATERVRWFGRGPAEERGEGLEGDIGGGLLVGILGGFCSGGRGEDGKNDGFLGGGGFEVGLGERGEGGGGGGGNWG